MSSLSPPWKRHGVTWRELSFDIQHSPSHDPHGYLVFVFWGPVHDETHRKTVIVSPVDLPLPGSISPETMRPFESSPKFSGSPPGSSAGCVNVSTSSTPICRVCHEGDQTECLVSLCKCSGNMSLLHVSCLEHLMNAQERGPLRGLPPPL
ncbi:hypothetical protein MRX96_009061 [Rhipicephalus microplus]